MRPLTQRRSHSKRIRSIAIIIVLALGVLLAWLVFRRPSDSAQIGDRSQFASDACIEYNPTSGDNHRTVFLDPGHGGIDPGASGTGPDGKPIQEKTVTLAVGMDTLDLLRAEGYHVAMARTTDTAIAQLHSGDTTGTLYTAQGEHGDIAARAACANAASAKLLLSIHFNSYSDPSVGGVETLYDPARAFSAANMRFANDVQHFVLSTLATKGWRIPDRGIQPDTSAGSPTLTSQAAAYGHLLELGPASPGWFNHPSTMPGALCEPLFLTDPGEVAVVVSDAGQHTLARGFVSAIDAYFAGK